MWRGCLQIRFRKKSLSLIKILMLPLPKEGETSFWAGVERPTEGTPCPREHLVRCTQSCSWSPCGTATQGGGQGDRWFSTSLPGLARHQLPAKHFVITSFPICNLTPSFPSRTVPLQERGDISPNLPSPGSAYNPPHPHTPSDTHTDTHAHKNLSKKCKKKKKPYCNSERAEKCTN